MFTHIDIFLKVEIGRSVSMIGLIMSTQEDTKARYVSWAIFEVKFGKTLDRSTSQEVDMTRSRMKTVRVCVFHIGHKNIKMSGNVCVIKWTFWQEMATRHALSHIQAILPQKFRCQLTQTAFFNSC